jgi:small GTP-binding protein
MQKSVEKKVCLLGDWGVGKTSLIRRFVFNAFDDRYLSTLGVKVSKKGFVIKDFKKKPFLKVNLTLLIWDLVGQKGFQYLQATAFKGTNGALIVCDVTRPETIEAMERWISSLYAETKPMPLIFLANKVDLTENAVPLKSLFRRHSNLIHINIDSHPQGCPRRVCPQHTIVFPL